MQVFVIKNETARQSCIEWIQKLKLEPAMKVQIKPYVKKRSTDSNSLYWLWLEVISKDTGYTKDELHDKFRSKFLPIIEREVRTKDGVIKLRELTSTTSLNSKEFDDYMREIEIVAIGLDIKLVYPDELIYTLRG